MLQKVLKVIIWTQLFKKKINNFDNKFNNLKNEFIIF